MDSLYRPHPSWLPATYLLLATIALIAFPLAVLGRVDETTIVLVGLVYVPLGWAVVTVFAAVRIRPRVRFDARRWVGLLALPLGDGPGCGRGSCASWPRTSCAPSSSRR